MTEDNENYIKCNKKQNICEKKDEDTQKIVCESKKIACEIKKKINTTIEQKLCKVYKKCKICVDSNYQTVVINGNDLCFNNKMVKSKYFTYDFDNFYFEINDTPNNFEGLFKIIDYIDNVTIKNLNVIIKMSNDINYDTGMIFNEISNKKNIKFEKIFIYVEKCSNIKSNNNLSLFINKSINSSVKIDEMLVVNCGKLKVWKFGGYYNYIEKNNSGPFYFELRDSIKDSIFINYGEIEIDSNNEDTDSTESLTYITDTTHFSGFIGVYQNKSVYVNKELLHVNNIKFLNQGYIKSLNMENVKKITYGSLIAKLIVSNNEQTCFNICKAFTFNNIISLNEGNIHLMTDRKIKYGDLIGYLRINLNYLNNNELSSLFYFNNIMITNNGNIDLETKFIYLYSGVFGHIKLSGTFNTCNKLSKIISFTQFINVNNGEIKLISNTNISSGIVGYLDFRSINFVEKNEISKFLYFKNICSLNNGEFNMLPFDINLCVDNTSVDRRISYGVLIGKIDNNDGENKITFGTNNNVYKFINIKNIKTINISKINVSFDYDCEFYVYFSMLIGDIINFSYLIDINNCINSLLFIKKINMMNDGCIEINGSSFYESTFGGCLGHINLQDQDINQDNKIKNIYNLCDINFVNKKNIKISLNNNDADIHFGGLIGEINEGSFNIIENNLITNLFNLTNSSFINCSSVCLENSNIKSSDIYFGGIIGEAEIDYFSLTNNNQILNAYNLCDLTFTNNCNIIINNQNDVYFGGIIGYIDDINLTNIVDNNKVKELYNFNKCNITNNCKISITQTGKNTYFGGFVGRFNMKVSNVNVSNLLCKLVQFINSSYLNKGHIDTRKNVIDNSENNIYSGLIGYAEIRGDCFFNSQDYISVINCKNNNCECIENNYNYSLANDERAINELVAVTGGIIGFLSIGYKYVIDNGRIEMNQNRQTGDKNNINNKYIEKDKAIKNNNKTNKLSKLVNNNSNVQRDTQNVTRNTCKPCIDSNYCVFDDDPNTIQMNKLVNLMCNEYSNYGKINFFKNSPCNQFQYMYGGIIGVVDCSIESNIYSQYEDVLFKDVISINKNRYIDGGKISSQYNTINLFGGVIGNIFSLNIYNDQSYKMKFDKLINIDNSCVELCKNNKIKLLAESNAVGGLIGIVGQKGLNIENNNMENLEITDLIKINCTKVNQNNKFSIYSALNSASSGGIALIGYIDIKLQIDNFINMCNNCIIINGKFIEKNKYLHLQCKTVSIFGGIIGIANNDSDTNVSKKISIKTNIEYKCEAIIKYEMKGLLIGNVLYDGENHMKIYINKCLKNNSESLQNVPEFYFVTNSGNLIELCCE